MKPVNYRNLWLPLLFVFTLFSAPAVAQSGQVKSPPATEVEKTTTSQKSDEKTSKPTSSVSNMTDEQRQGIRGQRTSEDDAAQLQYLKNYIEDYRLGPEDVITVEVFGPQVQIYSQQNITVPPDGKVNYKLIGQINVRGRTVQDVEKEITEKLNEYIIDPKVTVQLVQSHSMKYIVDGDVGRPSVYEMTRRMTVREAIVNAGGILPTGDKSKVQIARAGLITPIAVNFRDLEKGKGLDEAIAPGDMIFVPGNRFKSIQKWMQIVQGMTTLPMILIRR